MTSGRAHILPSLGQLRLGDVRSADIPAVLEEMVLKRRRRPKRHGDPNRPATYSQQTLRHVRGVMHRLFDAAWRAEIIESNPRVARAYAARARSA